MPKESPLCKKIYNWPEGSVALGVDWAENKTHFSTLEISTHPALCYIWEGIGAVVCSFLPESWGRRSMVVWTFGDVACFCLALGRCLSIAFFVSTRLSKIPRGVRVKGATKAHQGGGETRSGPVFNDTKFLRLMRSTDCFSTLARAEKRTTKKITEIA